MPTLFISYKRGTSAVAPLMDKLKAAKYRLWFDRDEIHLGDPDWQARIDEGLNLCDGMILCLSPAACASKPVQYEVKKAQALGKPIFPIVLEKLPDWSAALVEVGLTANQHTEDFTDVEQWSAQLERLLRDLRIAGLIVTAHDERQQRDRNNPKYVLHQQYLRQLVERVGLLSLAHINPEQAEGVYLEDVYIDSPTDRAITAEVKNFHVADWSVSVKNRFGRGEHETATVAYPADALGYERPPLEALVGQLDETIQQWHLAHPDYNADGTGDKYRFGNKWKDDTYQDAIPLQLQHIAAARQRLVILGAPGSGKSTFVKHLALCLAGAQLDDWGRVADVSQLEGWTHGALTPVYIELRRFVASKHFPSNMQQLPTADHLWAYIEHDLLGRDLAAYTGDLRYDLEHGQAVIILDGLDEVPYPEGQLQQRQQQLIALCQSLNTRYATSRVLVASRPYAYEGWQLPDFEAISITAFTDEHRVALAQRLYQVAGLSATAAQEKAQALNQQLRQIDPELKDRPLFVTLMATIYLQGDEEGLPTRRGALYRASILLLLDRWTQSKANAPSLTELLGDKSLDDLYTRLAALAYDVHRNYGEQAGTPEIDEMLLYKHLKPLGRTTAAELIPYLSENAGVLVSPGQDAEKDVFHFAHRTFQEYLAAAHIASECTTADSYGLCADLINDKPQIWRIPLTLVGDVLADTDRRSDLWDLLDDLLDEELLTTTAANDPRWWRIWLASNIADEQGLAQQQNLRRGEKSVRELLRDTLVQVVTIGVLPPPERALCGQILGVLGDTRPHIGLNDAGLPDIDWVKIPAGEFSYQDETATIDTDYYLSRYLLTYQQYQAFLDAADGFADDRWWAGMPEEAEAYGTTYVVREQAEQAVKYGNHPREMVSWYQAMAFCRWLSYKLTGAEPSDDPLTWVVRLPTEREWEKGARGNTGWQYPYGDEYDPIKANTSDTGIGQTSAVGLFANGASPYGILDMSGNVYEWCVNKYEVPYASVIDRTDEQRVLRGGSFFLEVNYSRAVFRSNLQPNYRFNRLGLRLFRRPSS